MIDREDTRMGDESPEFQALVALGSNLSSSTGSPAATLSDAIEEMARSGLRIARRSRFFHTPCFPPGAGPDFVNAVVRVETRLAPADLLDLLQEIEQAFGRERQARWAARTLDLDLIAVGDLVSPDEATFRYWLDLPLERQKVEVPNCLVLPHPRLQERAFVLVPAADVAPEWCHPVLKRTIVELLDLLPERDRAAIHPLPG